MDVPRSATTRLVAALVGIMMAVVLAAPARAGYGSAFDRYGAKNWALANYAICNGASGGTFVYDNGGRRYKCYGSDCTNFVSTAWNRGGRIPMSVYWHQAQWTSYDGYYFTEGSYSFIRVRDIRSYWYSHGTYYYYVTGEYALGRAYSPAGYGDAYIFDSGDSSYGPDWEHSSIAVRWSYGYDEYAQHSYGKVVDWRTWYWKRTSWQRSNFIKSGHGIRVIAP